MMQHLSAVRGRLVGLLLLFSFLSAGNSRELDPVPASVRHAYLTEIRHSAIFSETDCQPIGHFAKGKDRNALRLGFYNYVGGPLLNKTCQWEVYEYDGSRGEFDYLPSNPLFTTIFEDPGGTPRYMVRPYWATWIGDRVVMAAFLEDVRASTTVVEFFGYLSYEPHTMQVEVIGSGNLPSASVGYGQDAAFDLTSGFLYLVGEDKMSLRKNSCRDTVFEKVGEIRCPTDDRFGGLICIAANRSGSLYGLDDKANLYRIDKNTVEATYINKTDCQISSFGNGLKLTSSATFDYATNSLWFAEQQYSGSLMTSLVRIDTLNGKSEYYDALGFGDQSVLGLFDYTYLQNVPFENAQHLELSLEKDERSCTLSFNHPERDIQGGLLTKIGKAYVLRKKTSETDWTAIDSISDPVPGSLFVRTYAGMEADSSYDYAVYHTSLDGKVMNVQEKRSVRCIYAEVPYFNGFEEGDPENWSLRLQTYEQGSVEKKIYRVEGEDSVSEGMYAYRINSGADMVFHAFPVRKGAVYRISADVWSAEKDYTNGIMACVKESTGSIMNGGSRTSQVGQFENLVLLDYLVQNTGQLDFHLYNQAGLYTDQYYLIDNIRFEELVSCHVPQAVEDLSVTADSNLTYSVKLDYVAPSLEMGGDPLEDFSGIIVEYSPNMYFNGTVYVDTVYGSEIGKKSSVMLEVSLEKPGRLSFRVFTFNRYGRCSEYVEVKNVYVGREDRPANVENIRMEELSDSLILSWDEVRHGINGGWTGDVDYLLVRDDGTGLDSVYAEEPETKLNKKAFGLYTFSVTAIQTESLQSSRAVYYTDVVRKEDDKAVFARSSEPRGSRNYPIFHYPGYAASSQSQFLYEVKTGEACYVDSLHFFINPVAERVEKKIRILVGERPGEARYYSSADYVPTDRLTEVFDGTAVAFPQTRTLSIPVEGWFYDGENPLVVHTSVPYDAQETGAALSFFSQQTDFEQGITLMSVDYDLDTLKSLEAGTTQAYVPTMAVSCRQNMGSLEGTLTDFLSGVPIDSAWISIHSVGPDMGSPLRHTLISDPQGRYRFDYMPENGYVIRISALGYEDLEKQFTVRKGETFVFDTVLYPAAKIALSGRTILPDGEPLQGVIVEIEHAETGLRMSDTTGEDGSYCIGEIYGMSEYGISFMKSNMVRAEMELSLGTNDTVLDDVVLYPEAYSVGLVTVGKTDTEIELSWMEPLSFTEATWVDYGVDTMPLGLRYSSGSAFRVGVRFDSKDLLALDADGNRVTSFGFVPMDATATYIVSVCQDADAEDILYSDTVSGSELAIGQWNRLEVRDGLFVDGTKELWAVVSVESGYEGAPVGMGTSEAYPNKGDLIWSNGRWVRIGSGSAYKGNLLISLYMENLENKYPATGGYLVYRGKASDDFASFIQVSAENVRGDSFREEAQSIEPGVYRYAVVSDWSYGIKSAPAFSDPVSVNMEVDIVVKVRTNGQDAAHAGILLKNVEDTSYVYAGVSDQDGKLVLSGVRRGFYDMEVAKIYYHPLVMHEIRIFDQGQVIETDLMEEIVSEPYIVHAEADGNDILLDWSITHPANWSDDVEAYPDFSVQDIGEWIMAGCERTTGMVGVTWENMDEVQSFIVFNPGLVEGWKTEVLDAHSGDRLFASFPAADGQNGNLMIRRIAEGGGIFSFYFSGTGLNDSFEVLYSETDTEIASFKVLDSYTCGLDVIKWQLFRQQLPQTARYVAIRHTSQEKRGILIDDLSYEKGTEPGNPQGYRLYLDGSIVGQVPGDSCSFVFADVPEGSHVIGVQAVYVSGESDVVEKEITVLSNAESGADAGSISCYPNPVGEKLHIAGNVMHVRIRDCQGREVYDRKISGTGPWTIDMSTWQSGLYFVILESGGQVHVEKIVKI